MGLTDILLTILAIVGTFALCSILLLVAALCFAGTALLCSFIKDVIKGDF